MSVFADKEFVVRTALDAGASAVAVTSAEEDGAAQARMRAAFARGDLATWYYDARYAARASRPASLLPGARSVICLAVAYANPAPGERRPLAGQVSNYAWAADYHRHVRAILETVAAALDARAGEPVTRVACDTAPLAERAFAERAGLGWVGKHTNLIVPKHGSFVFLGEIVTTLALETEAPLKKSCGSCTRCVSACPTGALRGDYTIDATRCISDLTQSTASIPRALRPLIGDWVWGCDLCQDACPPTQRAGLATAAAFAPRNAAAAHPDLSTCFRCAAASSSAVTNRRRWAGVAAPFCGATPPLRSETRSTALRCRRLPARSHSTRIRSCAGTPPGRSAGSVPHRRSPLYATARRKRTTPRSGARFGSRSETGKPYLAVRR